MAINKELYFSDSRFNIFVILLCVLEIANMFFMDSSLNLIVSIPELMYVIYLLYNNSIRTALLFHIIFSLTTFSPSNALRLDSFLSYSGLKIFGPFTIAYIILGVIWILLLNKNNQAPRCSMIFKARKICILLFSIASFLGGMGLIVFNYSFTNIISPILYMGICVLYLDIFVKLYDPSYLRSCYYIAIALIVSSPISTFVSYNILHITASYSIFDTFIMNEAFVLAPLLMLFLLRPLSHRMMPCLYISLVCYLFLVIQSGRGGQFLSIAICSLFFIYYLYFTDKVRKKSNLLKMIFPLAIFLSSGYFVAMSSDIHDSLGSAKLNQFFSIFRVFSDNSVNIDNLSNSPYMRVAEFLNVFDSELNNPIYLIFGKGYGGTYTDGLGLFVGIDLSAGSFSEEAAAKGVFATAHSMYPNVLLFHGIIGLYLVFKLGIDYLKKIKFTPLVFAAFSLFLYSFYFNNLLLLVCLFVLFASEFKIVYK